MRYRKAHLGNAVKNDLRVEFTESGLSSYAGLELLIRYLRSIRFNDLIRHHFLGVSFGGDYGAVAMIRLLIGLVLVGGRRLRHIEFLRGDGLFERFCGLSRLPSERTISRWLKHFTLRSVKRLQALNAEIVARIIRCEPLRTLTVDVDGSVISTGQKVERAFRGFNPHRRKVKSYYPITAYLAETGQVLRVKNRPGNIHDGKASITFLRELFGQIKETMGSISHLNFRMDGAFFHPKVLALLISKGAGFCIKVPFWKWLDLTGRIKTTPALEAHPHQTRVLRDYTDGMGHDPARRHLSQEGLSSLSQKLPARSLRSRQRLLRVLRHRHYLPPYSRTNQNMTFLAKAFGR